MCLFNKRFSLAVQVSVNKNFGKKHFLLFKIVKKFVMLNCNTEEPYLHPYLDLLRCGVLTHS